MDESSSGKISLGLSVISRVTLRDGAFHEDVGYGHIENCKGKAAAFEKAKKEATTDAMKRALRNFGNVLGNCLYDKDYLARVTKVKVPTSKWDVENLHRHPDFAPMKRESINALENTNAGSSAAAPPPRLQSAVSAQSNGTEYEDDYGGNLFDEVDFTHPDEVRLDDTPVRPLPNGSGQGANRQPMNRVASMPAMRTPNAPQQPARPSGPPQRQPSNLAPQQNNQGPGGRMMPPPNQVTNQAQRGGPQKNGASVNGAQHNGQQQNGVPQNQDGNRSNPSSASSIGQQGKASDANGRLTPPGEAYQPPAPMATPQGIPVGFVSGKAATAISGGDTSAIKLFDPHAESPSIRRTQGVDQRKSVPVKRSEIGAPPGPVRVPATGAPGSVGARPNFVNPGADPNRRIGAPGAMPSPMANRHAYKPPSILKRTAPTDDNIGRPALTDVSNMQQSGDGGEVKKQKLEPAGPQQNGVNGTIS